MMTKKLVITVVIVAILALGLGTGIGIAAAGTAGSADDPLITLSYLNDKFKVELLKDIDALVKTRGDEITAKINETNGGMVDAPADAFKVVVLGGGQKLMLNEGSELLVREGTAMIIGDALSNATKGDTAAAGSAALINNMYIAAAANCGVQAAGGNVKLLVRGEYTITA